jgi:hypothetical protein
MASSSKLPSATCQRAALVALLLTTAAPSCWTGRIFQAGRVRESVVEYRAAGLTQDSLRLDYTALLEGGGSGGRLQPRAARVGLAALRAEPEHPVDAFPLERVSPDARVPGEVPLALVREGQRPVPNGQRLVREGEAAAGPGAESLVVRVETDPQGHQLLRLCPSAAGPCVGQLYSAALYRDRTAWWVYPLLPLGIVVDAALLPLQLVTTAPFFLAGD